MSIEEVQSRIAAIQSRFGMMPGAPTLFDHLHTITDPGSRT